MKKKIVLKRILHRNEPRFAIIFDNNKELSTLVRAIDNSKWSQTNKCWYADDNEMTLKQILTTFREVADIDISEIVSDNKKKNRTNYLRMKRSLKFILILQNRLLEIIIPEIKRSKYHLSLRIERRDMILFVLRSTSLTGIWQSGSWEGMILSGLRRCVYTGKYIMIK